MIKKINKDIETILKDFDYKGNINNEFSNLLIYKDKEIQAILLYELIYDRIEIDYIEVKEDYRNKKIASKLMEELIKIAKDNSISNISLEVNETNNKAIGLYRKYNFKVVSRRKGYYNGIDGLLMLRKFDSDE